MKTSLCMLVLAGVFSASHAWWFEDRAQQGGSCYAPPFFWGAECTSDTAVFGADGVMIKYVIDAVGNVPTLVCCEAKACGPLFSRTCQGKFGFHAIGCSNSGTLSGVLPWGNNLALPTIKCKGNPTGTMLSWKH